MGQRAYCPGRYHGLMATSATTLSAPPLPKDAQELQRVQHTRLRRRILYNLHEADVTSRLKATVGSVREDAWPPVDMTANPARHVYSQLAALYRESPQVTPPDGGEMAAAKVAEAGYWQLAQRIQRDTLGLRETLVHVSIVDDEPVFRLVPPDFVEVVVDPRAPSKVLAVKEWERHPDDAKKWVRYVTDPRTATYRAEDDRGRDVSAQVLGGAFSGKAYPWRVDGKPVLPYVMYHAAVTGLAWDAFSGAEVFEGSLQLGVYYTLIAHVMADASWAQRWAIGAEPAGLSADGRGSRGEVVTDPATLLILQAIEEMGGQPTVGQWTAPSNPLEMLSAVERYERRIVEMALGTVGVSRRESDVRSSASLAVSREAQRQAQRSYEPLFRRADLALLRLTAGLLGAPTVGWRIQHVSIPKDPQERKADQDRRREEIDLGLLDKVTAYQQLHPGTTELEATTAIDKIGRINGETTDAQTSGAKMLAATDIVARAAAREIPRDAAIALLVALYRFSPEIAEGMLGSAGAGFQPATID